MPFRIFHGNYNKLYKSDRSYNAKHQTIKQAACFECGYGFTQLKNLKYLRLGVHLLVKRHECEECGMSVARSYTFQWHINAAHK